LLLPTANSANLVLQLLLRRPQRAEERVEPMTLRTAAFDIARSTLVTLAVYCCHELSVKCAGVSSPHNQRNIQCTFCFAGNPSETLGRSRFRQKQHFNDGRRESTASKLRVLRNKQDDRTHHCQIFVTDRRALHV